MHLTLQLHHGGEWHDAATLTLRDPAMGAKGQIELVRCRLLLAVQGDTPVRGATAHRRQGRVCPACAPQDGPTTRPHNPDWAAVCEVAAGDELDLSELASALVGDTERVRGLEESARRYGVPEEVIERAMVDRPGLIAEGLAALAGRDRRLGHDRDAQTVEGRDPGA